MIGIRNKKPLPALAEKDIEKKVCEAAKRCGWLVFKFNSAGNRGVPDRIFMKSQRVMFVEFKRPGKKPTELQQATIKRIKDQGVEVYVIDSVSRGKALFKN